MSILIPEKDLPVALTAEQAVEAAYANELAVVASKLQRGLPCLVECDKDLAPYVFVNVRNRLKANNIRCLYLDGRPRPDEAQPAMAAGLIGTMIAQLRDAVRGAVERRVVVLPHLDMLTTSQGGLTAEAREVIPLLYENPELVWLGFKDPSFPLPKVIENLFLHRTSLLGPPRPKLRVLITQKESRKFGRDFNPWQLYKYVSGVNAVRLRKLLSTLEGEDYPSDPRHAFRQLRQATLVGGMEVPALDLDKDIGGYDKVKQRLRAEILDVLSRKDKVTDAEEIARLEELIPKGMIFWGPPGTGKTMFAKAMASAIGAAITVVSGPELKSKWVGESEENLRRIFYQARQSAPSIIVFDELDSFATARGMYTGSGVEHSMVNQLLTEMDGFHKEEMVFVVGTTNFVESLDAALLRPGRFEFHLHIPYPNRKHRQEILEIYDRKMRLQFSKEAMEYALFRTSKYFLTPTFTRFSGDHLNALCRAVARIRIRANRTGPSTPDDIERGLTEFEERMELSEDAARLVATHEAGHFICSLCCPKHPRPWRVTIQSEMPWAPFYTGFRHDSKQIGETSKELLDRLCVLYGGIEAERELKGDVSTGASGGYGDPRSDLSQATLLARQMIEVCGMGDGSTGLRVFADPVFGRSAQDGIRLERQPMSGAQVQLLDTQITKLIAGAQERARDIVRKYRDDIELLVQQLIKEKTIQGDDLEKFIDDFAKRNKVTVRPRDADDDEDD